MGLLTEYITMTQPLLRLAQLSDFHYTRFPKHLREFFNKRAIGICNFLLTRRKEHSPEQINGIFPILNVQSIDAVLLTGDFTSTSLPNEFDLGKKLYSKFLAKPYKTLAIPGNHDCYTPLADQQRRFYQYFPSPVPIEDTTYTLEKDRVAYGKFHDSIWWVTLDTAISTPFFDSTGYFSEEMEEKLTAILDTKIPKDAFIILINHYPLYPPEKGQHRALRRAYALQKIVKGHPNVGLYLHGHNHHNQVINKQAKGLPITVDAGCCSSKKNGSWNLIELYSDRVEVIPYLWDTEELLAQKKWLPGERVIVKLRQSII